MDNWKDMSQDELTAETTAYIMDLCLWPGDPEYKEKADVIRTTLDLHATKSRRLELIAARDAYLKALK